MPTKRKIQDEAPVIAAYRAGTTVSQLAAEHKVSYLTIYNLLNRNGISLSVRVDEETASQICELYANGATSYEVARVVGRDASTVRSVLRNRGVTVRQSRRRVTIDEAVVVAAYQAGSSVPQLAVEHAVSEGAVTRILQEHGVVRRRGKVKDFAEAVQQEVVDRYVAGERSAKLGVAFGVDKSSVCRLLKQKGVLLSSAEAQRLPVDDAAFDVITDESAYWAGMMFTDGGISGGKFVQFGLMTPDEAHVISFKHFLKSEHVISHRPARDFVSWGDKSKTHHSQGFSVIAMRSARLYERLHSLGMRPFKKSIASPELINYPSFWRGLCDGDGTVAWYGAPHISLLGSKEILEQFLQFLRDNSVVTGVTVRKKHDCPLHRVQFGYGPAEQVIRLLYAQPGPALARKQQMAARILSGEVERDATRCSTQGCDRGAASKKSGLCVRCAKRLRYQRYRDRRRSV